MGSTTYTPTTGADSADNADTGDNGPTSADSAPTPADIVRSKDEAQEWFLRNHDGPVECRDGVRAMTVDSYPDAERFFDA